MPTKHGESNNGTREGRGAQVWFNKNVAKRRRRRKLATLSKRRNRCC